MLPLCEIVWDDVMEDTYISYTKAKMQMHKFDILIIVFIIFSTPTVKMTVPSESRSYQTDTTSTHLSGMVLWSVWETTGNSWGAKTGMFLHWLSSSPGLVRWIRPLMMDSVELRCQHLLLLKEWNLLMQWAHLASSRRSFTVPVSTRDERVFSETSVPVSWILWVWGQVQLASQQVVNLQFQREEQREECPKERHQCDVPSWHCDICACTLHPLGGMGAQKQWHH